MYDREKVIQSLEQCTDTTGYRSDCYGCIHRQDGPGLLCREQLMRDAIALLRGQEEERERLVRWLGKFCAHADQQYQPRFTDEANIEFFRQKMREQFGWKV